MHKQFYLEIITPQRIFFSGDIEMIIIKTINGEMGVMKGHIPMIAVLAIGTVKIFQNDRCLKAVLNTGFMEVKRHRAVILTDSAEWPHEIDVNRARSARIRAEERLHRKLSRIEYQRSQAALARALERLKVSREIKG